MIDYIYNLIKKYLLKITYLVCVISLFSPIYFSLKIELDDIKATEIVYKLYK